MARTSQNSRILSPNELSTEIGKGAFRPVYYFYGEEDYRKTEAVKFIIGQYLPDSQRVMNTTRMTVDQNDFEEICAELAAIPMLGERRVLVINEIQKLKPTQQKKFYAFLTVPPPETVVILMSPSARTPQKKSAFFRDVQEIATTINFGRLQKASALQRVERQLKAQGITYDREAIELLVSLADGDFGGLTEELEKLSLASPEGTHIGIEEVRLLSSSHESFNIFELIDLVADGEGDKALYAYNDLIDRGTSPVAFLNIMGGHMLNLLKAQTGARITGAPFFVNKLKNQARKVDRDKILRAISGIAEAERGVRLSGVSPVLLVENLIREISV